MIPDLQSSILCDDVRQEHNGKFILIGIYDSVAAPSYPLLIQRLCVVNRWCCGIGRFTQKTRIIAPDGSTVVESGCPIVFAMPDDGAIVTNVEFFMNVKFTMSGVYWIEVLVENEMKIRYPLKAVSIQPPQKETRTNEQ